MAAKTPAAWPSPVPTPDWVLALNPGRLAIAVTIFPARAAPPAPPLVPPVETTEFTNDDAWLAGSEFR